MRTITLPTSTPGTSAVPRRLGALAAAACIAFGTLAPVTANAAPADASNYTQTKYPVVLVHGLFGFSSVFGVNYFFGVADALRAGGATVYAPTVSAANSNEVRGEQLLQALRQLKAATGAPKFNLIAHSQGAGTARYVAAVAPDLVASVTTVGGAQGDNAVADNAQALVDSSGPLGGVLVAIVNGFASLISTFGGAPGSPQDIVAALGSMNSKGAADFNRRYPMGAPTTKCGVGPELAGGVRYYSAGGVAGITNPLDPLDLLGVFPSSLAYGSEANDGLVSRCASHWGLVIKDDFPWNHFDEVNQTAGLRGLFTPDPVAFYRSQANRLKTLGL